MVVFASIVTFLAGLYSLLKWYKLGYDALASWAWVLVIGVPIIAFLNKYKVLPLMFLANLSVSLMVVYCSSLIYHLEAIHSAHIFWIVGGMVFAYLVTDNRFCLMWFFMMTAFSLFLVAADQAAYEFPHFELNAKQAKINLYSGYLLPIIVIGASLWFSGRIKYDALDASELATMRANEHSTRSDEVSSHLGDILQDASVRAETLVRFL